MQRYLACLLLFAVCSFSSLFPGNFPVIVPANASDTPTTLDDLVRQLAERVAAIPNLRGPLRVQYFEDGALAFETGNEWKETFGKALEKAHVGVTDDSAANLLRVGVAETPTDVVLSAGVHLGEREEVRFVTLPRTAFHAASAPVVPVRIEKQLVLRSVDRVLDASVYGSAGDGGYLVLGYRGTDLSVMKTDAAGTIQQIASLSTAGVKASRDYRGEVAADSGEAKITLPEKGCQVGWATAGDTKCRPAKATWRMPVVLVAPCGGVRWKVEADGADWSQSDLLQVVPEGELSKGSSALLSDFAGPILNISGSESRSAALVVTRNLRTGSYEVYKVTLACGN